MVELCLGEFTVIGDWMEESRISKSLAIIVLLTMANRSVEPKARCP
jgi:hypothetical protein